MGCSYIQNNGNPLTPAPFVTVPPAAPVDPLPPLDPLPAFDGTPAVPTASGAEPAQAALTFPTAGSVQVGWAESAAPGMVAQVMEQTGTLAQTSQAQALSTLEMLAGYAGSFVPVEAQVIPVITAQLSAIGEAPVAGDLTPSFASAPSAPVSEPTQLLDVANPPAYDVSDIDIMDIDLPDPFDALLPAEPVLDAVGVPAEPDMTLPPVPSLQELAVPPAPAVEVPLFEATMGAAPDVPEAEFSYSEVEYDTALLSALRSKMATLVGDRSLTGIELTEQRYWDRAAAREARLTDRAFGEARRVLRARGARMPETTLARVIEQALQGGLNREATLQRDVGIERAQLQQTNFRFAVETAVTLESRMIDKANSAQRRSLEAAKAVLGTEIRIFNVRVSLFAADVAAFAVRAEVFKARLVAALAHIEVFKAQLEAARVVGEINAQRVAIYKAQIEAVRAIVETYRTRIDAAKSMIEVNQGLVDIFRARIGALEAQIDAKNSDYQAYAARVKGEALRAEVFGKQVDGYKARVGAYGALVKAKVDVQTLRFKQANEFPLELYKANIDAYKASTGAVIEQLKAVVAVFDARVKAFTAQEDAKYENVDAQVKVAAATAQAAIARADTLVDAGKANLQAAEGYARIAQDNLRSVGQLSGQLAAAAVAAQSVHASVSELGAFSVSNSASDSASNSESTSSTTATGSSSSTNVSHSATSGTSISNSLTNSTGRSYNRGYSNTSSTRTASSNTTQISGQNSDVQEIRYTGAFITSIECEDVTTHSDT